MSKDFWIGIDQTLNTRVKLCDGYGKPDEMFSARFRVLISFIFGSFYVNAALWAYIEKFPRLIPRYGLLTRIALWRDSGGRFLGRTVNFLV